MLCLGDYSSSANQLASLRFCSPQTVARSFQQCGSLPGCFGQGHPRRADIPVLRVLVRPGSSSGPCMGREPRRLCAASAPGAIPLAPVFPPSFAASCLRRPASPPGLLNVAAEGKVQNKVEKEVQRWAVAGHTQALRHPPTPGPCQSAPDCGAQQFPGHGCSRAAGAQP